MSQTTAHMHGHHEATMGLAGPSLGRELRARALSHTAPVQRGTAWDLSHTVAYRLRPHTTNGWWHQAQQPWHEELMKSMSADMFLDLPTMSAPNGEERRTDASAQVERAGWCCRRSDSSMHTCCGRATVMVLVSSSSDRPRRRDGPAGSASDPGARAEMARR